LLFSRYSVLSVLGPRLDHAGSRNVIGHVTIRFLVWRFLSYCWYFGTKPIYL